jgi:hypothetical protein
MASTITTRVLVLSDTHGESLKHNIKTRADVAIHCGDLTEESKVDEFRSAIRQLKEINAPLKLVIAGNPDFTLNDNAFERNLNGLDNSIDEHLLEQTYGRRTQARCLLEAPDATAAGIRFLTEGIHHFTLENGAALTVYASPYTPSLSTGWGFTYNPQRSEHEWKIDNNVDIVVTHGPPRGLLDYTDSRTRAGSGSLFAAIARRKPKMHCFGHIHEAWGARTVTWREEISDEPSHFTDIDDDQSVLIESRSTLKKQKFDIQEVIEKKQSRRARYEQQGYCDVSTTVRAGEQTLFVNAAVEGLEEGEQHLPFMVEIELPMV